MRNQEVVGEKVGILLRVDGSVHVAPEEVDRIVKWENEHGVSLDVVTTRRGFRSETLHAFLRQMGHDVANSFTPLKGAQEDRPDVPPDELYLTPRERAEKRYREAERAALRDAGRMHSSRQEADAARKDLESLPPLHRASPQSASTGSSPGRSCDDSPIGTGIPEQTRPVNRVDQPEKEANTVPLKEDSPAMTRVQVRKGQIWKDLVLGDMWKIDQVLPEGVRVRRMSSSAPQGKVGLFVKSPFLRHFEFFAQGDDTPRQREGDRIVEKYKPATRWETSPGGRPVTVIGAGQASGRGMGACQWVVCYYMNDSGLLLVCEESEFSNNFVQKQVDGA